LQENTYTTSLRTQARLRAAEGLEILRHIRDRDFDQLADGTYGMYFENNSWVLKPSPSKNGPFERSVVIRSVDSRTRSIESLVSWQSNRKTGSIKLQSILTNWREPLLINTWARPTISVTLPAPANTTFTDFVRYGNYIYAASSKPAGTLFIIDCSNPAVPTYVTQVSLSGSIVDFTISGNSLYAITTDTRKELQILSLNSPSQPVIAGTFDITARNKPLQISAAADRAYILSERDNRADELYVLNVTSPASVSVIGSLNLSESGSAMLASEKSLLVASHDNSQELTRISLANETLPAIIGTYNLPGGQDPHFIIEQGGYIGIGQGDTVYILNHSGSTFTLRSQYDLKGLTTAAVDSTGGILFVGSASSVNALTTVNLSTVPDPTTLGTLTVSGGIQKMQYREDSNTIVALTGTNAFVFIKPE
jgi:hypothetical protein